jgi:hypothetical protein
MSPEFRREVIVEFLEFSKFPRDQMEKMVEMFIEGIKIESSIDPPQQEIVNDLSDKMESLNRREEKKTILIF